MERVVPGSGLQVDGRIIPAGTIVSIPQYVAHRDKEIYGEDAMHFELSAGLRQIL